MADGLDLHLAERLAVLDRIAVRDIQPERLPVGCEHRRRNTHASADQRGPRHIQDSEWRGLPDQSEVDQPGWYGCAIRAATWRLHASGSWRLLQPATRRSG